MDETGEKPCIIVFMTVPVTHFVEQFSFSSYAQGSIAVGFLDVKPGFLRLLLTQTWVKCTSLYSSRCVVYSGVRFKAIQAASKNLELDGW